MNLNNPELQPGDIRTLLDDLAEAVVERLELDDETAERAVQIDYRAGQICLRADLVERLLNAR